MTLDDQTQIGLKTNWFRPLLISVMSVRFSKSIWTPNADWTQDKLKSEFSAESGSSRYKTWQATYKGVARV